METKQIEMYQSTGDTTASGQAGGHPWLVYYCLLTIGLLAHLTAPAMAAEPVATAPAVSISTDRVYGTAEGVKLLCDVYLPAASEAAEPRPAVLVIHGGAWSAGSRRTMTGYAMRLARAGIVAIAVDYRLAPTWKFPAQVDDVRLAMLWVVEQAAELGIDPTRIGLFGYSAGGHLACMIGTLVDEPLDTQLSTTNWDRNDQRLGNLPQPQAICAGGPPCDLTTLHPDSSRLAYFLGGKLADLPEVYAAASPVSHASAGDIPTLYVHGERDAIVPLQSSRVLYEAQRAAGVASEFVTIEKQGHLMTFLNPKTGDAVVEFFRKQFAQPTP